MNGTTFNTHRFFERLIEANVPKKQAKVFVEECSSILDSHVATKSDLELLESRLWAKMLMLQFVSVTLIVGLLQYFD